ncbi:MAG: AAA family ATPase [Deltaproteobacteria bacterium]|jgi:adenylate kinase|nr:AAA family ATPase [Deltaproteobacteria bacterium]
MCIDQERKLAILLIGPTGSGKSPLGKSLEEKTDCAHFDFGAHLRKIASGKNLFGLSDGDKTLITELIQANALLPEGRFDIAEKILEFFIKQHSDSHYIVLNGLPRHVDQAKRISQSIEIRHVVHLRCTAKIVRERVHRRKSGKSNDDSKRDDDCEEDIARKIKIFNQQTKPILDYYCRIGLKVIELDIDFDTTEDELLGELRKMIKL